MVRSALIIAAAARLALGGVVNVCLLQPYNEMQSFRDFEPAKAHCAPHYPAQTVIKALSPTCLTTTETVVLATSTITATSSEACPTADLEQPEHEDSEEANTILVARDENDLEARGLLKRTPTGAGKTGAGKTGAGAAKGGPTGKGPVKGGATGAGPVKGGPTGAGPVKGGPTGAGPVKGGPTGAGPVKGGPTGAGPVKGGATGAGPVKGGPTGAGPTKGGPTKTPPPQSDEPVRKLRKRDAAPTQAAHARRDAIATKSSEWEQYYTSLVQCGYDCIQTACGCIAPTHLELRTPKPTCTSTSTKSTVIHLTTTVVVSPKDCS